MQCLHQGGIYENFEKNIQCFKTNFFFFPPSRDCDALNHKSMNAIQMNHPFQRNLVNASKQGGTVQACFYYAVL